jgi:predicted nuclease of predicted toxin-antitoxin system
MIPGSRLSLYLDEDVDVLLAQLLTPHGFDCLTAAHAGRLGESDEEQLAFATRERRVLITHNARDYYRLAIEWARQGREHSGIVLATRRRDVFQVGQRVLPVLTLLDQDGWKNCVMYA